MKTLLNKSVIVVALLWLATAAQALEMPHIQVAAEGSIEVMPDFMRLQVVVEKTGEASDNKQQVDKIVAQVIAAAQETGIDKPHIDASQLSIQPYYEWQKGKRLLKGETVRRTVSIKLYRLDRYTELAAAVAGLDISQFSQQGFGFDKPQQQHNKALVLALNNARDKATVIAETLGRKLGRVYQVSESGGFSQPMPVMRAQAMAMQEDAGGAPLEVRPQTVTVNVNMVYMLE